MISTSLHITKLGLFLRSGTALTMALAAVQVSAAETAPAPPPAAEEVDRTEIVVTAQKREQKLQDVGIAISVLSKDDLEKLGELGQAGMR